RKLVESAKPGEADAARGRAVFARTCAVCHTLYDEGGKVGPELTNSNRRDLGYLIENVVDPSATVTKGYEVTVVRTRDGGVVSGVVRAETPTTITLHTGTAVVDVSRADVDKLRTTGESLMPEGLLTGLNRQDVLDLVAYLRSDGPPPGPARQ
ncbi:MAG TPA: c-type cytochrome, partial [Humisphaera sp.]